MQKSVPLHFYKKTFKKHSVFKKKFRFGNGIGMTVTFDNLDEHKSVFDKLSVDGNVIFDFFQTTIDTNLVCVIDKFGIHWYLNYVTE